LINPEQVNRIQLREYYQETWGKYENKKPLTALEQQIADVIALHPEYHKELMHDSATDKDYALGDVNPFLHLSLHLAVQEHVMTNRPAGIKALFTKLLKKQKDAHITQHTMMDCLASMMWTAQQQNKVPEESEYLACIKHSLHS
jgi:hypothetical protein